MSRTSAMLTGCLLLELCESSPLTNAILKWFYKSNVVSNAIDIGGW